MSTLSAKLNAMSQNVLVEAQRLKKQGSFEKVNGIVASTTFGSTVYGMSHDGLREFARDLSVFLWDEKLQAKYGQQKGFFFENVLNEFIAENDQKSINTLYMDMHRQFVEKVLA